MLALAGLLPGLLPGAAAAASGSGPSTTTSNRAPADPDQPLRIDLDTLSPAVVPQRGPVQVTGLVTNVSEETWTAVNLYVFSSARPLTTDDELADAVETDPGAAVGARVVDPGTFEVIGDLQPEESSGFTLRVPRSALDIPQGEPGVYWFGVHALGTTVDGRDQVADGRARTFLAQLDQQSPQLPVSLVLPLRRPVVHTPDGSLARVEAWTRLLEPGGRLRAQLDFGSLGSDRALTWMVDPAVLDAVDQLARGNPPRSIAPTRPPPGTSEGGASPSDAASNRPASPNADEDGSGGPGGDGSGGGDASGGSSGGSGSGAASPLERRAAELADEWGLRARPLLGQGEVLALPYADLDVAGALVHQPGAYARALSFSAGGLSRAGLASTPVFAPPDGRSDAETLDALKEDTTVLLSEQAVQDGGRSGAPVRDILGRDVVLIDEASAAGGPGPDRALSTVQVRQRLLAETALRSLAGDDSPLATVLPRRWVPDDPRGFFLGIEDAPWIRLATLGAATAGLAEQTDPALLVYPEQAALEQVGALNFAAVQSLTDTGALLETVLTRNAAVGAAVAQEALSGASYAARNRPVFWRRLTWRAEASISDQLGRVRVEAPPSVTLSSEEGKFAARVLNDLDEPVTVRIEARTDDLIEISAPESISLTPGERTSVLLTASTSRIGLHDVQLVVTAPSGVALGSRADLPIRSAQVSWIIWVVIAVGGAVLVGAIVVRLARRLRSGRDVGRGSAAAEGAE